MKNVKQARVKSDRLSELPDSLILSILGLLPMSDVVRTAILSKRWQHLWTTVNCLNFDDSMMHDGLVERALNSWRGVNILKFEIDSSSLHMSLTSSDVDSWVRFAMDHQVQELNIHLMSAVRRLKRGSSEFCWSFEAYCVPQDLYSCSWLKELSLKGCSFDIEGDVCVQWNQLKSLTIHGNLIDGKAISRILCGSPQLEIFHLALTQRNDNLIIRSSSLKNLSINMHFSHTSPWTELAIWTPNLEILKMSGIPYPECLLMDVSSLTHATLGFYGRDQEDTLRQILPTIQHVETLTLVDCCIKALGAVTTNESFPSPLPNVKSLQLVGGFVDFEPVVSVLEVLSTVETLVLRPENDALALVCRPKKNALKVERNLPNSFLLQLRTVEVTWIGGGNSIFPLIEFLLKYASKLEKVVFREEVRMRIQKKSWKSLFLASRRLLKMSRSSNCRIDFLTTFS